MIVSRSRTRPVSFVDSRVSTGEGYQQLEFVEKSSIRDSRGSMRSVSFPFLEGLPASLKSLRLMEKCLVTVLLVVAKSQQI